jgi:hypothetical protein
MREWEEKKNLADDFLFPFFFFAFSIHELTLKLSKATKQGRHQTTQTGDKDRETQGKVSKADHERRMKKGETDLQVESATSPESARANNRNNNE